MAFLNFNKIVLKSRYSYNFKTIFRTVIPRLDVMVWVSGLEFGSTKEKLRVGPSKDVSTKNLHVNEQNAPLSLSILFATGLNSKPPYDLRLDHP